MNHDFLNRIVIERDYKISLLSEMLELGNLDKDILFRRLNEITTLQYRFLGHFDIVNLTIKPTLASRLRCVMQSFDVLEKSISFTDGVVASLSSDSMNRNLLNSYHGSNEEICVREKIMVNGQHRILESYGLWPSDL